MSTIVTRIFWTERGPVVDQVNRMRQFRAHCYDQAAKLAASARCESAIFDDYGRLLAFTFAAGEPVGADAIHWRELTNRDDSLIKSKEGIRLWVPALYARRSGLKATSFAKALAKEMEKFQLPMYANALAATPFGSIALRDPLGTAHRAQLHFHGFRVFAVVPYWGLDGGHAWNAMTPAPEGWTECSPDDYRSYADMYKAGEQPHGNC